MEIDELSDSDNLVEHGLLQEIANLKREKEQLSLELWKYERRPSRVVGSFVILFGVLALLLSIVYTSDLLSFVGFGLIFWGSILIYIRPKRHVRADLLGPTIFTLVLTVSKTLKTLGFAGRGIYLPPQNPEKTKDGLVFIPSKEGSYVPRIEELEKTELFCRPVRDHPIGICLPSAGLGLANLFERELATSFTGVDIGYLKEKLAIVFTEILGITKDFEIETIRNRVYIKLKEPILLDTCRQIEKSLNVCYSYACPLCSSLATVLARSTGKPVVIERTETLPGGKTLEILYRILKEPTTKN